MTGRIRTIKPEMIADKHVATLSHEAFRLFVSMISMADDYGNLNADPSVLDGAVFHSTGSDLGIQVLMAELAASRLEDADPLVCFYKHKGQIFSHLNGWSKHQKVNHPGKPRYPAKDDPNSLIIVLNYEKPLEHTGDSLEILGGIRRNSEDLLPDLRSPTSDLRSGSPKEEAPKSRSEPTQTSVSEQSAPPTETTLFVFPCRGHPPSWPLTAEQAARWTELYPGIDVVSVCRRALAWSEANPAKRKTAGRMRSWLVSVWLNGAADRSSSDRPPQLLPTVRPDSSDARRKPPDDLPRHIEVPRKKAQGALALDSGASQGAQTSDPKDSGALRKSDNRAFYERRWEC